MNTSEPPSDAHSALASSRAFPYTSETRAMPVPETEVIVSVEGAEVARHTVRPGEYVLGRAEDADLGVEAECVSPRHAQLTINYDHALIEDLGSSNGTFVNGRPGTETTRLWPGQASKSAARGSNCTGASPRPSPA
jgi:pSer/pThr/pTyr-binding forkhead associated (FHA) protein